MAIPVNLGASVFHIPTSFSISPGNALTPSPLNRLPFSFSYHNSDKPKAWPDVIPCNRSAWPELTGCRTRLEPQPGAWPDSANWATRPWCRLALAPSCATRSSHHACPLPCCAHAQPRGRQPCPPRIAHLADWFSPSSSSGTNQSHDEALSPKSKLTQNQNRIWKITLEDLLLNFKDPFVFKFDLSLKIHLFLIPSFYFQKRFKPLLEFDQNWFKSKSWKIRKLFKPFLSSWSQSLSLAKSIFLPQPVCLSFSLALFPPKQTLDSSLYKWDTSPRPLHPLKLLRHPQAAAVECFSRDQHCGPSMTTVFPMIYPTKCSDSFRRWCALMSSSAYPKFSFSSHLRRPGSCSHQPLLPVLDITSTRLLNLSVFQSIPCLFGCIYQTTTCS
jgi:hypothetical protein